MAKHIEDGPMTVAGAGEPQAREDRAWLRRVDAALGLAIDVPAAGLVVAEVVVLLAGVVSRYVFELPLVWSDELASILFIWLAMLGSVGAFRRGEHMQMTAFVSSTPMRTQAVFEAFAGVASAVFLVLLLLPAYRFAMAQVILTTPALGISDGWRAAALPVGIALMLVTAILRLVELERYRNLIVAAAVAAAILALFYLAHPFFRGFGNYNLVIFFVLLVAALVFSGVPIAFAFGLATFGYLALTTRLPVAVLVGRMDEGMGNIILLAVPLFVLLGYLIEMTGMARAMVVFLASLLGHVRGGLSYVLIAAMYLVSGISGSKTADMAAVAPVLFPEMRDRGAKPGELLALLSATGAQTETVPPSLVLITIGSVTGVSIAALFTGGLLPSAVLALALVYVVWLRNRDVDQAGTKRARWAERGIAFVVALPALILPFLIRAAVVEGIATATEVSTIGIAYCLVIGPLLYRQTDWRRLYPALVGTAVLSGAILLIIGAATGMAWALTQSGFSHALATTMKNLPGGVPVFLGFTIVAFVVLGSVLEGIPAVVLFGPLTFPIAKELGVNEVHYAMVVVLAMGIGLFAPPFGVGYYSACAVSRIHPNEGIRPMVGYLVMLVLGVVVVAAIPWISTGFL